MKHFTGHHLIRIVAGLALLAVLIGCTGKQGPTGPKGDTGAQGPPGSVSRTIYAGTVPATADSFFVALPSMSLSDPSLVSTFVQVSPNEYDELPFLFQFAGDSTYTMMYASIREGGVTLWYCHGLSYIIVVLR
jgi:hypothetical protein